MPQYDQATADLLQRAHDYIEINGFDIQNYEPVNGASCYIGTLRLVAGVEPGIEYDCGKADEGDGPELTNALRLLDSIARKRLKPERREKIKKNYPEEIRIGRFVEELGFEVELRYMDSPENAEREKKYALTLLRKALTEIHG